MVPKRMLAPRPAATTGGAFRTSSYLTEELSNTEMVLQRINIQYHRYANTVFHQPQFEARLTPHASAASKEKRPSGTHPLLY